MKTSVSQRYPHQSGAVLMISLILLVVASMVTLSSMTGSQMQERMTSNQHNQTVATMAAEAAAADLLQWLRDHYEPTQAGAWMQEFPQNAASPAAIGSIGHYYVMADNDTAEGMVRAVIVGLSGLNAAQTPLSRAYMEVVFSHSEGEDPSGEGTFSSAIVGCEGVASRGSGRIDSYNSRQGAYNASQPGSNAHVSIFEPDGTLDLIGNSPIYGNVYSAGSINVTGSSSIHGSIYSDSNVLLSGGGVNVYGDVVTGGNITFSSSATVQGNGLANGDISFGNWSARLDGNAQAGGAISGSNRNRLPENHVGGTVVSSSSPENPPLPTQPCDALDIASVMGTYASVAQSGNLTIGSYPRREWVMNPTEISYYDETWNVNDWVVDAGRPLETVTVNDQSMPMLKVGDLDLTSNGSLHISGGDVALFVEGDFSLGGNSNLTIDPDSSLTIYTTGRVMLQGSVGVNDNNPVNNNNEIALSIFSSFSQASCTRPNCHNNAGVRLRGNTNLSGVVYAPFANVALQGSGDLFGSVRGRTVSVTGAGGIHYDEALADILPIPGGGSGSGSGGNGNGNEDGSGGINVAVWRSVTPL